MLAKVEVANASHQHFSAEICALYEASSKARGTGIARRNEEFISNKITSGDAVIATQEGKLAAFSFISTYDDPDYIAHSGLIVKKEFRGQGLAKRIKRFIFDYSREKYPDAAIFGITTSPAVMKMNSELGYKPVSYSELPASESFWKNCASCPNYEILQAKNRKMCMCTALLYLPEQDRSEQETEQHKLEAIERLWNMKMNQQIGHYLEQA